MLRQSLPSVSSTPLSASRKAGNIIDWERLPILQIWRYGGGGGYFCYARLKT